MTVPYSFGSATSAIPLSQLDSNFNTPITLGNTAIQLGNTVTTLNNMTLANVTISSGNVTITNVSVTTANVTTGNITNLVTGNAVVTGGSVNGTPVGNGTASTGAFTTLSASSTVTLSGGTANAVAYLNGSKVVTTGSALVFDGTNLGLGVTPSAWGSIKAMQVGTAASFSGGSGFNDAFIASNAYYDGTNWKYINSNPAYYASIGGSAAARWYTAASGTAGNAITFSQPMTLDASGNLGIGTSSPAVRLHVAGLGSEQFRIEGGTATGYTSMNFLATGRRYALGVGNASETALGLANNFYVYDSTASATRLVIDSSGNLGLGVTPSAWGSSSALQMAGGQSYSRYGITNNAYYDGGNYRYISTAAATLYGNNAGSHLWFNAASGTAGNAITFTQAMTLDSSGNLLVGANANPVGAGARVTAVNTGAYYAGSFVNDNKDYQTILVWNKATTGTRYLMEFGTTATYSAKGSITTDGTNTAYNTSSDYRLKNITGPISNSGAYIDSLNPVEGTWKENGSVFVGLIAHEVQEVSRTSIVTGEKDGEKMQSMDYSSAEIIANLIAEVKSLRARVAALES